MMTTISEKRWPNVIRAAIKLAEEKVLGKLAEKDERVAALRAQVQNPSNLDLAVEGNKTQAERDRETLRRDFRHWGIKASFRKNVGGVVQDLSGAAVALAFGGFDAQLVNAVRRLVVLTGIQPEWVTKVVGSEGLYLEDKDGNPTVAAIMAPAKAKLAEAPAAPGADDDIVASLLNEGTRDAERQRDQDAFDLVEKWLLAGGKPQGKPAAQTTSVDRNAVAVARATELAAAGRGTVNTESLPVAVDETVVAEPTLEERAVQLQGQIDAIFSEADSIRGKGDRKGAIAREQDAAPFEEQLAEIRAAIDAREAEAAARAAEAEAIAAQAAAEANVLEPEDVHIPVRAAVDPVDADFAKLVAISGAGNARATKLVDSVLDLNRSKAEAVDLARTVRLI